MIRLAVFLWGSSYQSKTNVCIYWPNQKIKIMFNVLSTRTSFRGGRFGISSSPRAYIYREIAKQDDTHLSQRGRARNCSKFQSLYRKGKLGIFKSPIVYTEGTISGFFQSQSLYSRGYFFIFPTYFFAFFHIFYIYFCEDNVLVINSLVSKSQ